MKKSKAQTTIEYAILVGVTVGALIAMQVYMKRGLQGKIRNDIRQLTEGASYSPGATNGVSVAVTTIDEGSQSFNRTSVSTATVNQLTNRTEEIMPFANEPRRW